MQRTALLEERRSKRPRPSTHEIHQSYLQRLAARTFTVAIVSRTPYGVVHNRCETVLEFISQSQDGEDTLFCRSCKEHVFVRRG